MKYILLLITLIFTGTLSLSQISKVESELMILYADEEYEKCANRAIKMASKKERNNPIVYLYASKACLKISQIHQLKTEHPKSFKDALKYAGKYRKKDKSGHHYNTHINHFEELKRIIYEEVQNNALTYNDKTKIVKGAKKSVGLLKRINKFSPNDQGAWLLRGLMEIKRRNNMEGKAIIKKHLVALEHLSMDKPYEYIDKKSEKKIKIKAFKNMSKMEQMFLQKSIMEYAKYLNSKNKEHEALEILALGKPFFYKNHENLEIDYTTNYKKLLLEIDKA